MPYCAFCEKTIVGGEIKIVRAPKDNEKRQLWEKSLQISLGENSRLCELHFEANDFKAATNRNKTPKRRFLMPNAIPKKVLRDTDDFVSDSHKNCSTQTDSETIDAGILLECFSLKKQVAELELQNARLTKELEKMNNLKEALKDIFTDTQLVKLMSGGKKKMWTSADISYGLCLHAAGPQAYNHLYKKGFPLPSLSTLHRWLRKIDFEPGILEVVLNLMQQSVDVADEDKICVLSFDQMKISANNEGDSASVQVAMVQGLRSSWKQPVYYDYNCRMDKATLENIILKLHNAGYPVVAIVSDLGPGNQQLWSELGISTTKTWFEHPADDSQKIYVFADVPYLVKLIRHHFLDSGLCVEGITINAQTIKQVLNHTATSDVRIIFKVTEEHLNVNSTDRKKVELATELLSNTTASAIDSCYSLGFDVKHPCETAGFFKLTNDWYDIFKSKMSNLNPIDSVQPYGKSLERQRRILKKMSDVMSVQILPNQSQLAPFQNGIIVSNSSLDGLYTYLKEKYSMSYILTNRLNQDVLDEFFGAIRAQGGLQDHPNPLQFKYKLRKYILSNDKYMQSICLTND